LRLKTGVSAAVANPKRKEQYNMKSIKIAGLCLVAMFVVSVVTASVASAKVPEWKQCRESSGAGTKWEDSKCTKPSKSGKWEWKQLETKEAVTSIATLKFRDKNTLLGEVEIQCQGTDEGTVGPQSKDEITSITIELKQCKVLKNCEKIESISIIHLPWETRLAEENGQQRDKIKSSGAGAPGWVITCHTGLGNVSDECTSETGSTLMEDLENGTVNAIFEKESGKAKCTQSTLGSKESGEVEGTDNSKSREGWALMVS
jgi:hypothetical protein